MLTLLLLNIKNGMLKISKTTKNFIIKIIIINSNSVLKITKDLPNLHQFLLP